jgi:preprotein translocase subunit SecG
MTTVVLSLHLLVTIVLIFLILLQKSEGSAGGGFGGGVSLSSMMQPRSRPNALTRATGILALTFFATSMGLALLARETAPTSILAPVATSSGGAVPKVSESILETPAVPSADAPAAATPAVPDAAAPAPAVPKVPN